MNFVDAALGWCTGGRTAQSFSAFTSAMVAGSGAVAVARAFAMGGNLEQSFAKCLVFPQKRQRLFSMWRCRSAGVSLPSLLSFPGRSGPVFAASVGFPWALG